MGAFSIALKMFNDDCGRYPTTAEGLAALIKRPQDIPPEKWHKYLDVEHIPTDPWGHAYVYRYPGVHNTNAFDIYSCGPDGKSQSGGDDPDDINNWNMRSPLVPGNASAEFLGWSTMARLGAALFLVVLALAWAEKRFRKSEGNFHGVYALLWFAAAPPVLMVLDKTLDANSAENVVFVSFFVWFPLLLLWMISGIRRGSPFSKGCALFLLLLILLLWFLARALPKFA
jgi:general secretion pathway protein G